MKFTDFVTMGKSGLKISPLTLGTMTFGEDWGWGTSETLSHELMDNYFGAGGNFIDTANIYTNGHSEEIVGNYFEKHQGRDRKVIATKFNAQMFPGDPNSGGGGRKNIIASCEESLRRLKTDYIDLYWLHVYDRFSPIEETLRAFDDLVTAGKIRYVGISDTYAYKAAQAITLAKLKDYAPVIALQLEYSLLERTIEGELVPLAVDLGLGINVWSPLKYGALSGKYTRENNNAVNFSRPRFANGLFTDKTYDIIDLLIEVGKELEATPSQIALAYIMAKQGVTSTIIGARSVAQLHENINAVELELPDEVFQRLDEISAPSLNFPFNFLKMAGVYAYSGLTINGENFSPRVFN